MSNSGFRGTEIQISEVIIKGRASMGTVIQYKCLFTDPEGVAHGQITHEITATEGFGELTKALVDACRAHAASSHFSDPSDSKKEVVFGIAESLKQPLDTPDRVGEQG